MSMFAAKRALLESNQLCKRTKQAQKILFCFLLLLLLRCGCCATHTRMPAAANTHVASLTPGAKTAADRCKEWNLKRSTTAYSCVGGDPMAPVFFQGRSRRRCCPAAIPRVRVQNKVSIQQPKHFASCVGQVPGMGILQCLSFQTACTPSHSQGFRRPSKMIRPAPAARAGRAAASKFLTLRFGPVSVLADSMYPSQGFG